MAALTNLFLSKVDALHGKKVGYGAHAVLELLSGIYLLFIQKMANFVMASLTSTCH